MLGMSGAAGSVIPERTLSRLRVVFFQGVPWVLAAWLLAGALPRLPWVNQAGVDASWYLALNHIHDQGIRFGTEIAYTMGPLGYLFTPEPELASATSVLLLQLVMWSAIVTGAVAALRRFGPAQGAAVTFILVTQALLDRSAADVWQAAYMAVFLSFLWASEWAPVRLALAAWAAGLTMLLKVNEGWAALALYYAICAPALWRRRPGRFQTALFLALPPAVFLLCFVFVERNVLAVLPYLRNSLETMRGYSEAMSLDGPLWQLGLTVLYGALILSTPALAGQAHWLRSPGLLCFLLAAFMGFKHAMVRQDGHADLALQKLALAGLFLLSVCAAAHCRRILLAMLAFGSAFTWCYVAQEQNWLVQIAMSRLKPSGMIATAATLARWDAEYLKLQPLSTAARQHLRLPEEFHKQVGNAPIDGFPHCIDSICANGWNYRPRPTIESSGAYTRKLDLLNAAHLAGPNAPRHALFRWEAIDGRHPLLQEHAALQELKTRYRLALRDERALLLERRARPLQVEWIPAGEAVTSWDRQLRLPESRPGESIYLSAEIRPSVYGSLRWFLLRAAPLHLRVWRRSGREGYYRMVRSLLAAPVQIRPLPETLSSFASLLEDPSRPEEDPVEAIGWYTPRPYEYAGGIRVRWLRARWLPDSSETAETRGHVPIQ